MITRELLLELFEYREGELFWKKKTSNKSRINIGDKVGFLKNGYLVAGIDGRLYKNHNLIYLMHHGELPDIVDHIDGNSLNNKIENLRPVTINQNNQNRKKPKNNSSGVKGINWDKQSQSWKVGLMKDKKSIHLGYYMDFDEAVKVITEARNEYHGNFAKH